MIKKTIRLFFTLRNLKLKQFVYFILRRGFPATSVTLLNSERLMNASLILVSPLSIDSHGEEKNSLSFLNDSRSLAFNNIDWRPKNAQRLWAYNLHYFDYLRDPVWLYDEKQQMITDWAAHNPQGSQPGWEPFTCSLRLVNWIFYLTSSTHQYNQSILDSLYLQARWLEKNDERHILANHYFENLKALLFAGCFFIGKDADRWRERALVEIPKQLQEQTLQDGGHYERSPQYHALMLENYLDIYNLAINNGALFNHPFIHQVKHHAIRGLDFLNTIVFPDNQIPLFNDSAFNIAPSLDDLNQYAERLFSYQSPEESIIPSIINKPNSGFYGLKSANNMLIMTCGDIVPAYQPGHTHCDLSSFELMMASKRVIVDTGVYEYEPGELRHYVRSTRAHNTISIDGDEQSEIWGEFRIARRAKKHAASIKQIANDIYIATEYSGFYGDTVGFQPRFNHHRSINVKLVKDAIDTVTVVDKLIGKGVHTVESYVHFHPDFSAHVNDDNTVTLKCHEDDFAVLSVDSHCEARIEKTIYCPEFGLKQPIDCLVISRFGVFPTELSYRLQRL
jgi:uncharacterized heparinase superfamily protein